MIVLTNSTTQIAFSGFTQEAKNFIKDELSSLDEPVFLFQMRITYPLMASNATSSIYNYGGVDPISEYEEWNNQKDLFWFNVVNTSTTDKYILLPLSLTYSTPGFTCSDADYIKGPTYSPSVQLEDGQYTFQLRMVPIGQGVIPELTGINGPVTPYPWPNGTYSYSNIPVSGWTQSHLNQREIVRPAYVLQVGRLLVTTDPITTRVDLPLGYDNGLYNRKDDDDDVYL